MPARLKTLVLDANGVTRKAIASETLLRGVLRLPETFRSNSSSRYRVLQRLVGARYEATSYMLDWRDAFCRSPALDVELVNISNLLAFRAARSSIRESDLVVVLHSAAGDNLSMLNLATSWFQKRRGKLVVFIGNEYELMSEKKRFLNESGADYVCSQLPADVGRWLYSDCADARVLHMPHALNPLLYRDLGRARNIDIGFVGDLYDRAIGDRERTDLIQYFTSPNSAGLRCDVRVGKRLPRGEWAEFLNACNGIVGAESGTYYLDRDGVSITRAKEYVRRNPTASFEEVFEAAFRNGAAEHRSAKAISSRHFEPIGTKTCQILVEGRYNDILRAEEHYISVRKDLSDIEQALERFADPTYRSTIAGNAYDHVMGAHTYAHRISELLQEVAAS